MVSECPRQGPIPFVESKPVDFQAIREILSASEDANHWANFGPVSRMLEQETAESMQLSPEQSVVMCSSATAALFALVAAKEYQAGRPLRWVASAYGFYSSWIGPLADAQIVDCDGQGMLDIDALEALPADSFDAVLVTNIFAGVPDVRMYQQFCSHNGKELIVDNALAFAGFSRQHPPTLDEIVSFHHTKPWGMGEGGCAIVSTNLAEVVRAMTNFGVGLENRSASGGSNAKISDFSCALILHRISEVAEWSGGYRQQARRILGLAEDLGFRLLLPIDFDAVIPPHLPLLASSPVPYDCLTNEKFVMRKYYLPHPGRFLRAQEIYSRIVNVPCHPEMAELSDEEIGSVLRRLFTGTETQ